MSRKIMQQALEALETLDAGDSYKTHNAATALRQAIAQAEKQEIVAFRHWIKVDNEMFPQLTLMPRTDKDEPLYTAPPRKPWVGLTEDEVFSCFAMPNMFALAHAVEIKLKDKNT